MGEVELQAPQPDKVAMQGQACSAVAAAVPSPALCTVHTGGAGHMGGRWVPGSASAWWPSLCGEPQASRRVGNFEPNIMDAAIIISEEILDNWTAVFSFKF